jgi:hypothetical protein
LSSSQIQPRTVAAGIYGLGVLLTLLASSSRELRIRKRPSPLQPPPR